MALRRTRADQDDRAEVTDKICRDRCFPGQRSHFDWLFAVFVPTIGKRAKPGQHPRRVPVDLEGARHAPYLKPLVCATRTLESSVIRPNPPLAKASAVVVLPPPEGTHISTALSVPGMVILAAWTHCLRFCRQCRVNDSHQRRAEKAVLGSFRQEGIGRALSVVNIDPRSANQFNDRAIITLIDDCFLAIGHFAFIGQLQSMTLAFRIGIFMQGEPEMCLEGSNS